MASVSELINYANYISQSDPLANSLTSGLSGFFNGIQHAQERKKEEEKLIQEKQKNQLDTYIKLLDIQDKMQKISAEKKNAEIQQNIAKTFGFAKLTDDEVNTAKSVIFDNLGDGKKTPSVNTNQGKLNQLFNSDNYDADVSYNPRQGFTIAVKKKKPATEVNMTENQRIERNQKIRNMAEKMAIREQSEIMKQKWNEQINGPLTEDKVRPNITEDQISKYLKPAELYLTGKTKEYDAALKAMKKNMTQIDNPYGLLNLNEFDFGGGK